MPKPKFGDMFYNPITKTKCMYVGKPDIPEHHAAYIKALCITGVAVGSIGNYSKYSLKPL